LKSVVRLYNRSQRVKEFSATATGASLPVAHTPTVTVTTDYPLPLNFVRKNYQETDNRKQASRAIPSVFFCCIFFLSLVSYLYSQFRHSGSDSGVQIDQHPVHLCPDNLSIEITHAD